MQPVFTLEPFPDRVERTVFLAGPTPRDPAVASWRPGALDALDARGFTGTVFVPEPAPGRRYPEDEELQIDWELEAFRRSDVALFWVPRDLATMPAFTTNVELGLHVGGGRAVLGVPPGAPKTSYLLSLARRHGVPCATTLEATVDAALALLGPGEPRQGGACQVPLAVWREPVFRRWLAAHEAAGNTLVGARLVWSFRSRPDRPLFAWALHADVHVAAEGRRKQNEVVLGRPDVASVVLYRRSPRLADAEVALVREARVAGPGAGVLEPPGGSSFEPGKAMCDVALAEVEEEVGLTLAPERLRPLGERQVLATLLAHRAHAWAVELTPEEMDRLRAQAGVVHGADACERTTIEVWRMGDLLARQDADWSAVGMILAALV